jgi:hypothetical protein
MGVIFRLFRLFATGNFRGIFTLLLGLTLVWGLWETSLVRLSDPATAIPIMVEVGNRFITPLIANAPGGITESAYSNLEKLALSHPSQAISLPGIQVQILGSDIAGKKTLADGLAAIYPKLANVYYYKGPASVFTAGTQISNALGQFSTLTQAVTSQGAQAAGVPQLPQVLQVLSMPLDIAGLNPGLFTAGGHATAVIWDERLLGAAAIFALLLMIFSPRLHRISSVSWSVITGAAPGVIVLGLVWFLWSRNPATFQPYAPLLSLLGKAFLPVYIGAFAVGIGGVVLAKVGDVALKAAGIGKAAPAHPAAAGFAAYGQSTWKAQPDTPRGHPYGAGTPGGQGATWDMPPAAPSQRPPAGGYSAPGYGGQGFAQGGQQAWSGSSSVQGSWRLADQGQPGRNAPNPGGWGQSGQAQQAGQPVWPAAQPEWPPAGQGEWPQTGQAGLGSQGGWGNQPQPGYGQPGQGRPQGQPGSQSAPGQQRGAWPPPDEDGWPPRR